MRMRAMAIVYGKTNIVCACSRCNMGRAIWLAIYRASAGLKSSSLSISFESSDLWEANVLGRLARALS